MSAPYDDRSQSAGQAHHDNSPTHDNQQTPNAPWNFEALDGPDNGVRYPQPPDHHHPFDVAPHNGRVDDQEDELYLSTPPGERHDPPPQELVPNSTQDEPPPNAAFEEDLRLALEESVKESEQQAQRLDEEHEAHLKEALEQNLVDYEQRDHEDQESQLKEALEQSLVDQEQRERLLQQDAEGHAAEMKKALEASLDSTSGVCKVGLHPLEDPVTLACGHAFCSQCLRRWSNYSVSCPVCGGKCLTLDAIRPTKTYMLSC